MSAVVITGLAAICVGVVWYERWQVRRAARRRGLARRLQRPWSPRGQRPIDNGSRHLATAIERAVLAGDVAWSYRDLYQRTRSRQESPFELRRGRMEASIDRYALALERVRHSAHRWMDHRRILGTDAHRRDVVERLIDFLESRLPSRRRRGSQLRCDLDLDLHVDVLEATLAHLRDERLRPAPEDPFRW